MYQIEYIGSFATFNQVLLFSVLLILGIAVVSSIFKFGRKMKRSDASAFALTVGFIYFAISVLFTPYILFNAVTYDQTTNTTYFFVSKDGVGLAITNLGIATLVLLTSASYFTLNYVAPEIVDIIRKARTANRTRPRTQVLDKEELKRRKRITDIELAIVYGFVYVIYSIFALLSKSSLVDILLTYTVIAMPAVQIFITGIIVRKFRPLWKKYLLLEWSTILTFIIISGIAVSQLVTNETMRILDVVFAVLVGTEMMVITASIALRRKKMQEQGEAGLQTTPTT